MRAGCATGLADVGPGLRAGVGVLPEVVRRDSALSPVLQCDTAACSDPTRPLSPTCSGV